MPEPQLAWGRFRGDTEDDRIDSALHFNNLMEIGQLLGNQLTQAKQNTLTVCLSAFRELVPVGAAPGPGGEPEERDEPPRAAKPVPREVPPPEEPRAEKPRKVLREIPGN